jgi:hypothetical protein
MYTPDELKEVDARVRAQFENRMRIFCSEIPDHEFARNERGDYTDEHVYGLFAGYILNFLCLYQTREGAKITMKPGLLEVLPTVESYQPVQCMAGEPCPQ